ncbi:MAG: carboxypeptidase regulatory-like domain-containing protein [Frankia sp.]|nr:carboxypeptidase regulatory-like domain-containing protein [Frankia sp.]
MPARLSLRAAALLLCLSAAVVATPVAAHAVTAATISGRVTSASSGMPVGNICVSAEDAGTQRPVASVRSASDGSYTLAATYVDRYYGHALTFFLGRSVGVGDGQALTGIDEALDSAGSLSGTLTDDRGLPVDGLCVSLTVPDYEYSPTQRIIRSDAAGHYRATNLPAGSFHVQARACGSLDYVPTYYPQGFLRSSAAPVTVSAGADTPGVDIAASRAGTVTGSARRPDGSTVPGLCVVVHAGNTAVSEGDRGATTDAQGSYTVVGAVPGSRLVEFHDCASSASPSVWYPDKLNPGDATRVEVPAGGVVAGIDGVIDSGATMSGVVTDTAGAPVDSACVRVFHGTEQVNVTGAMSDADGQWIVRGLPAHPDYYVEFSGCGVGGERYARSYNGGAVRPADAVRIDVPNHSVVTGVNGVLQRGGSLSGTVVRADNANPIKDVWVVVFDPTGFQVAAVPTDAFGTYTARQLNPGDYTVRFGTAGMRGELWYDGGSSAASATPVTIASGVDRPGVNARITYPSVPGAPPAPAATPYDGRLDVWVMVPSDHGASPLTDMQILADGVVVATTSPADHSVNVSGLTNGHNYVITTRARNAQGAGPESPATRATPSAQTSLAISVPGAVTYPGTITVSARLRRSLTGSAVGGVPVKLYSHPHGVFNREDYIGSAVTAPDGLVRFTRRPTTSTDYLFRYDGNAAFRGSMSATRTAFLTAPISVTTSATTYRLGQTISFGTSVSPNRAGAIAYLQIYSSGGWRSIASRTLTSTSRATFTARPTSRGTYSYRIYTPYTTRFQKAFSRTVVIRIA